ncbi:ATP-binding protein [Brevibacillus laterosporus]|uniref:sensor histidine kinase n=1 Tax=Brevibacillus laterosporus TaxID=1465 RepID=UPI00215C8E6E|nr:ATP-binding protein [Brevibacillus laterosporus]MCR8939575.1 ATP-binding protein [Brevibacillus laterosporus]MCZ0842215.1 ATP-binding protein [Brevibacillus laterosporus]MCZ0846094.1 ATP-binding protein [Brevibacillus laterosporus]
MIVNLLVRNVEWLIVLFRWVLLIMLYATTDTTNIYLSIPVYVLLVIQTLLSIVTLYRIVMVRQVLLIAEFFFLLYWEVIQQMWGISDLWFTYTSLILLGLRLPLRYMLGILVLGFGSAILFVVCGGLTSADNSTLRAEGLLGTHFVTTTILCGLIHILHKKCKVYFQHWLSFMSYIKLLRKNKESSDLCRVGERFLKRLFPKKRSYVFWFNQMRVQKDWQREFYQLALLESNWQELKQHRTITVSNFTGQPEDVLYFPLGQKGKHQGAILLIGQRAEALSIVELLFLHRFAIVTSSHLRQIKDTEELVFRTDAETRKQMAEDMHDSLAQQLFFLSAQLYYVKQMLYPVMNEEMSATIDQMEEQMKECHLKVRGYIQHLRFNREAEPLFDAIRDMGERILKGTGVQLHYVTKGIVLEESLAVEEAIYRVVEEALYNMLKHAKADQVEVYLEATSVQWTLQIKDNGIGFTTDSVHASNRSFGISNMRERMKRVGGTITIRSVEQQGTEITAFIPRGGVSGGENKGSSR